jgi:hypothetical protein
MKMIAGPFNPTFNYIDVVLLESNPKFADYDFIYLVYTFLAILLPKTFR